MTEKEFQAQIVELVGLLGGMVYHTYDSRRSASGFPDLTIVTRDRRLIFAELKNDRGRLTEYQKSWLEALPDHQALLVATRRLGRRRAHYPDRPRDCIQGA